ncbi:Protein MAIN-LIKE 1 [Glycine max]|nr:Protein MAIN-LIKE 1 [Glycine max]
MMVLRGHMLMMLRDSQEHLELKLVSHGRKVTLIGRPVPKIEGLVGATGLSPLIECSVVTSDPKLISAFVERWHSETNTFHLPVGELTITLDDVSSLLHLPISGAFPNFHALSVDEAIFLLTELLEVSAEEDRAKTARSRGAYVRLGWARQWIVAARAYLLHLVGCTLFANKSETYVHVVHLEAFRDLGQSGGYAWGVAVLHFPSVHQCVTDDAYQETSPRASQWLTLKAHMKGITGAPYRARCDALTVTNVCWLPYTKHRGVKGFELISSLQGQLRWGPMVVTARPERVLRQFGYIQSIPPPLVSASLSYDDIDDRWKHFADHVLAVGELCVVPGQAGDQPRHAPAADHEEYMQPAIPQVPVAFDLLPYAVDDYDGYEAIAEMLERVLNLRMVTVGTKLQDIMQDCLTIARGGASADGSVRARQRRRTEH